MYLHATCDVLALRRKKSPLAFCQNQRRCQTALLFIVPLPEACAPELQFATLLRQVCAMTFGVNLQHGRCRRRLWKISSNHEVYESWLCASGEANPGPGATSYSASEVGLAFLGSFAETLQFRMLLRMKMGVEQQKRSAQKTGSNLLLSHATCYVTSVLFHVSATRTVVLRNKLEAPRMSLQRLIYASMMMCCARRNYGRDWSIQYWRITNQKKEAADVQELFQALSWLYRALVANASFALKRTFLVI